MAARTKLSARPGKKPEPKVKGGSARRSPSSASRSAAPSEQAFAVILEDVRSQFLVFGEALQGLREQVAAGFDEVNRRFEQVDRRFEQVDRRFEQVDRRFDEVERDVRLLKSAAMDQARELSDIKSAVRRLEEKVDRKVDRSEVESIVEAALTRPRTH